MEDKRVVSKERGEAIAREHNISFLETSAKVDWPKILRLLIKHYFSDQHKHRDSLYRASGVYSGQKQRAGS